MKLIVATNNKNKILEIKNIINNNLIEVLSLDDINYKDDIVEDGKTFLENAFIKSSTISSKYNNTYVIADDSGLEVLSLNNEPGIYSKRYSGGNDLDNNKLILKKLEGINNREASFKTAISLTYNGIELNNYLGIWEGFIASNITGSSGFGYDPIFIPKGFNKTVSELDMEFKNKNSHRAKALNLFVTDFINNILKI